MIEAQSEPVLETRGDVSVTRPKTTRALWLSAMGAFVGACPASVAVAGLLSRLGITGTPETVVMLLTLFSPLLFVMLASWSATGKKIAAGARVESDRTLVIDDAAKTRIPADQLVSGATNASGAVQVLSKSGVEYRIAVPAGSSSSWLETLGLGAAHKLFHARMHRIFYQLLFWMLGAPTLIGGAVSLGTSLANSMISERLWSAYGAMGGFIVGALVSLWVSLHYMGSQVTIGTDGIKVRDGVFSQFIAWSDVVSTSVQQPTSVTGHPHLIIDTRLGKRHSIWIGGDQGTDPSTMLARIDEARAVAAASKSEVPPQLLAREGRSIRDWAAALVNLLDSDAGYRSQNVDPTTLLRLVRDAAAPIEQRIAAALALSQKESTRAQVRVVAEATANEHVRVALESAAAGALDEHAVEQAIQSDRVRVTP